jgi:hypothetical protein
VLQDIVFRRSLPLLATIALALLPATAADAAVSKKKAIAGPVEFEGESQFPTYAALGAGIYTTTLDRKQVAVQAPEDAKDPQDPGYEWPADFDEAVSEAAKYHIQIALTVKGGNPDFATAAAKQYPSVHLWVLPQTTSNSSYRSTLKGVYTALKARSKRNKVIAQPHGASVVKGAKYDMYGYTPAKNKKLPDLKKLHDSAGKDLFVTGWTLNTGNSSAAAGIASAFKAVKKASYVSTLGYDGLYDTDEVGSDGRIPKTGLLDNSGEQRPAYAAFKKG